MKTIRIKGSRPKDHPFPIVSWAIRLFQWSKISHVHTELTEDNVIFHAHFNDMKFQNIQEYEKTISIFYDYEIGVTDKQYAEILDFCYMSRGKRKGYFLQMFGISLISPFKWFGIKLHNPFKKLVSSNMCSQTCRYILVAILKFKESSNAPFPENYSTTDLLKLIHENIDT